MDANFSAVIGLPTNVGSIPRTPCKHIPFQGSPDEQLFAFSVAISLDIRTGMQDGVPYVTSVNDLAKVIQHIVSEKLDGWENCQKYLEHLKEGN
jgi:hypothetical protein